MKTGPVELLAPAGDFKTALAAFEAGADAVYCGLADFSARAFADNFTPEQLEELLRYARAGRGDAKKVYVTFNTLVDEGDVESAVERLATLDEIGPDGIIVQDLGIARLCRKFFPNLALHASTQLVAHNLEGVLELKDLGFSRVVLARELSLAEIATIASRCGVEIECFAHGALCYSLSGLCLFGAMEKGRSGNRGKCPYCCRAAYETDRGKALPFSMRDLRLGEDVRRLVDAGVRSVKIEGRMKSALYVASVTRHYREILSGAPAGTGVSVADLETVFSRRTTKLYFEGRASAPSPIDPDSLGHVGTEIGVVKRVTKDRDGLSWLRFHTARALEKHDGLQFETMTEGRHLGMGIVEMRSAISRRPVFEVEAGTDVEVLLPDDEGLNAVDLAQVLKPGERIYCSASQAVRRQFPEPSYRPSDYAGGRALDLTVTLAPTGIGVAEAGGVTASVTCACSPAKNPDKTFGAVEKAFSKLGGTSYRLGTLQVNDPDRLFAPMSALNDLRRDLVEKMDEARAAERRAKVEAALADDAEEASWSRQSEALSEGPRRSVKVRLGQKVPAVAWDEVVVSIAPEFDEKALSEMTQTFGERLRLALPVYTAEPDFARLRAMVKALAHRGYMRWEASDLATLRLLRLSKVADITADWTLYAFNMSALKALAERGVKRFVASPENGRENLQFLAESGAEVAFLVQQSTPLFISLSEPAARARDVVSFARDGLWVTTRPVPRTFVAPDGSATRVDLSWDPE